MKLKLLSLLSLFLVFISVEAQQIPLSSNAEISVLTIGPGTNLNDAFGHNAFRVKDEQSNIDVVYNYGVYDFETANFYLKFAQGKLNYKIDRNSFAPFINFYKSQDRYIEEQVLDLSPDEKQEVFNFLEINMRPENQFYLYDFFYDNCATKIKDVLKLTLKDKVSFNEPANFENKTFRRLIYDHVQKNSWGSFGIDIALGSVIDQKATSEEHMYLPKYIHSFFANAQLNNTKPLVKNSNTLYKKEETVANGSFFTSPLMVFGILGIIIVFFTYKDFKNKKRSKWLDSFLFAFTGLIGVFVLLLWFATDHSATANNYNLLWAFALNLFVIGQVRKAAPKPWFKKYLKFLIVMLCLLTLHWLIGVQVFAIGLIPFLIALLVRYCYLVYNYK